MKGDFTRITHDPKKHYSSVLKQQGRVDLDADWNEYTQIQEYFRITGNKDIIGRSGVPYNTRNGFFVNRTGDNKSLELKSGNTVPARIYVDGILCEMEEDISPLPNPDKDGKYVVYLDVWQRHITVNEDSNIAEVALGGPDTTTRVKTEWQVRFSAADKDPIDYRKFRCSDSAWAPENSKSTGQLNARAEQPDVKEGLCEVEAKSGYRGLENRLYRVEIHTPGKNGEAAFKWSRDNGSVAFSIQDLKYNTTTGSAAIALKQPGKDEYLTLKIGDWIEISDDQNELNLKKGLLAQVAEGSDLTKRIVVINVSKHDIDPYLSNSVTHLKLHRWDQKTTGTVDLVNGTIQVTAGIWIPLEDGVEVNFSQGVYQIGDYWLIPARTRLRDILWPVADDKTPLPQTRRGIEHHYCILSFALYKNGEWMEPYDCRRLFPSLNNLKPACCIPVYPGENIQEIIDCVIAQGGGCICLCDGVHDVPGPLKLINAENLTLCGENTATVVHFEKTDDNGNGGFILDNCSNVTITGMVLLGENIPSLIATGSQNNENPNFNISLRGLILFNRGNNEGFTGQCAIHLGNTEGVSIEGCRMLAENGIISLFGDRMPVTDKVKHVNLKARRQDNPSAANTDTELNYGIGVTNLQMKDCIILYRRYGIWTLKSIEWNISDCRIVPLQAPALPQPDEPDNTDTSQKQPFKESRPITTPPTILEERLTKISVNRIIAGYFENAISGIPLTTFGTAINALIWKDCRITNCTLGGSTGINAVLWLSGRIEGSNITTMNGLRIFWLHEGAVVNNTLESRKTGIILSGCWSPLIEGNSIDSDVAIQNAVPGEWLNDIGAYFSEISRAYVIDPKIKGPVRFIIWLLLEEACSGLGLTDARDAVQELLDTLPLYNNIPVLLLLSVTLYPALGKISSKGGTVPLPLVALKITGNEITAGKAGIRLLNFIPLGGLNIGNNRIQTLTGQAIEIKANPYTVNPYVVIVGLRFAGKFLPALLKKLMVSPGLIKMLSTKKDAVLKISASLQPKMSALADLIETIMEADYRIENNTIRSQHTAVEANIFEMAIQNNHVTLVESQFSNQETRDIIDILDQNTATKNLAAAMRQRSKAGMKAYSKSMSSLNSSDNSIVSLAGTAAQIQQKTTDIALKTEAINLQTAVQNGDMTKLGEALDNIINLLSLYIDTCGIWVKGAGCRIVGNQVVVPPDADSRTWANGGIRFWDDEGSPIWFLTYAEELLNLYKPDIEIPSLLASTETLIDNNEIIRGIGNGIEIGGITNLKEMGLADLKIRGNQIRDMGGAGIAFDERSITTGVDIEGNRILDCGSFDGKGVLVSQKGGVVIRNTVDCRIHNNRIKCNSNLAAGRNLFAVDLRTIYNLSMTGNHIEHCELSNQQYGNGRYTKDMFFSPDSSYFELVTENMCGTVKIIDAIGEIDVQHNELINTRGIGIGLLMRGFYTVTTIPEIFSVIYLPAKIVEAAPIVTPAVPIITPAVPVVNHVADPAGTVVNKSRIVNNTVAQTVDMPAARTVDVPAAKTVDVPAAKTVDVPAAKTVDVPAAKTVDVPAAKTVDVPAAKTMDVPAAKTVDVPAARTPASSDIKYPVNYTVPSAPVTAVTTDKPTIVSNQITTVAVQGNYFRSLTNNQYIAFQITRLNELNFLGNNVRTAGAGISPGYIRAVQRNLITGNMMDTLILNNVFGGIIAGNVSNNVINIPSVFTGKTDGTNAVA
jgi:hypothetical protein